MREPLWMSRRTRVPAVLADVVDHVCDTVCELTTSVPEVFEYEAEHVTEFRWRDALMWFTLEVFDEPHRDPYTCLTVYDHSKDRTLALVTLTGDSMGAMDTVVTNLHNRWPWQWVTRRGDDGAAITAPAPEKLFVCSLSDDDTSWSSPGTRESGSQCRR